MKYITVLVLIASVQYITNAVVTSKCSVVRLPNGRVRTRGRGRISRFSCYEGYTLVGNKYSTCIRGEWDTPTPVCVNSQCPELAKPDHALVVSKYDGAILNYFCEPGFSLIGTAEIYCNGRQWNGTSPYCRDTTAVAPTSCDFEKPDLCWWEQDPKHDFDWRRHNFETPSAHIGTGPTYDHTLGPGNDGYYLYIEASGRLINDTARIISPIYNASLTRSGCFSFWYHMYGDTIGALRVYFKSETESTPRLMFNKEGNQGNRWLNEVINLPAVESNFQILIEGVRGSNYVSDIAVDDVAILQNNECIEKNNTNITASDDDQIETLNAAQSCRGRCLYVSLLDTPNSDALYSETVCNCTLDCAENSTCCPDYAEYCVLGAPSETTDNVDTTDTTLSMSQLPTNSVKISVQGETPSTDRWFVSTKIFKPVVAASVTYNISKLKPTFSPSDIDKISIAISTVSIRDTMSKSSVATQAMLINTTQSSVESPTSITIDDVNDLRNDSNRTQNILHVTSENSQYLPPDTSTIQSPGILGAVIGTLAGISISVAAIIFILKKRKSYKRGTNGSALSEDSDVRFLTSDEILDFNVARPTSNDYNEL